jgi:hypothetical protein
MRASILFAAATSFVLGACGSNDAQSSTDDSGSPIDAHGGGDTPSDTPADTYCNFGNPPLQTDPKNCGTCGRDCLGAACVKGFCQPNDVVTGTEGTETVRCFTLDATNVYYSFKSNTGAIEVNSIPKAGGTPTTLANGENGCPMFVVGSTLYWLKDDGITLRGVPTGGGTPTTSASWTGADIVTHGKRLPNDGTNLYWMTVHVGTSGNTNVVDRIPLAGGTPVALGNGDPGAATSNGLITIDAASVYWFDGNDLKKIPIGGGTPVLLAKGTTEYPVALDVTPDEVVWLMERFSVLTVPLGGGVPKQLAGAGISQDMVIDATNAYYCDTNGISRHSLDPTVGGSAALLAKETGGTSLCGAGLEVDDTWVYHSNGDALIHRIPK